LKVIHYINFRFFNLNIKALIYLNRVYIFKLITRTTYSLDYLRLIWMKWTSQSSYLSNQKSIGGKNGMVSSPLIVVNDMELLKQHSCKSVNLPQCSSLNSGEYTSQVPNTTYQSWGDDSRVHNVGLGAANHAVFPEFTCSIFKYKRIAAVNFIAQSGTLKFISCLRFKNFIFSNQFSSTWRKKHLRFCKENTQWKAHGYFHCKPHCNVDYVKKIMSTTQQEYT